MNNTRTNEHAKEYLSKNPVDHSIGLKPNEVNNRIKSGKINNFKEIPSKTILEIIKTNLFTLFNILCFTLAILVLITGQRRNIFFIVAIVCNLFIGIIQEIRAKKTIEKLSLLKQSKTTVLRDGKEVQINKEEIVQDDIVLLKKGLQVPVDVIVVGDETVEVDESLLTGESDYIVKKHGDIIYSGSFIMQGGGKAQSYKIGKDMYINQLGLESKSFEIKKSEIQKAINNIIRTITFFLVPIGIYLFVIQLFFVHQAWDEAILRTVTGVIGMIPEGLVLLTSVAFAVGVVNLGRLNTLTQELSSIETLARVDTLCLDKTGTLTEGDLKVTETIYFNENEAYINTVLATIAKYEKEQNVTSKAIKEKYENSMDWKIKNTILFSSKTKWQAMEFEEEGTWVLGAPDVIIPESEKEIREQANSIAKNGYRVLALLSVGVGVPDDPSGYVRKFC
ncbi:MAG: HAD-IC family P-type ATPase [Oscillospiraceae bacterium]|nr:HAD-IC family P-type ATPase [Oscillospiraceae bacterium]